MIWIDWREWIKRRDLGLNLKIWHKPNWSDLSHSRSIYLSSIYLCYLHTYLPTYTHIYTYTYIHNCVYLSLSLSVSFIIYHLHLYIYIIYICIYIYFYTYTYTYIYTYIVCGSPKLVLIVCLHHHYKTLYWIAHWT